MEQIEQAQINKGARIYLIRSIVAPILMATLYFLSAGRVDNPRAWFYYGLFMFLSVMACGILFATKRELLYHRNRIKSDAKGWDKWLMPVAVITGFHLQGITMGLDFRFSWFLSIRSTSRIPSVNYKQFINNHDHQFIPWLYPCYNWRITHTDQNTNGRPDTKRRA